MKLSSHPKPEPLSVSRPNFWSRLSSKTPLPQDSSKYSCAPTITDISTELTACTKSRPSILKLHITQASPSSMELASLSSRETPFVAPRRSPLELESLLQNINASKGSARSTARLTPLRYEPDPVRLGSYLDYLGSRSTSRELTAFRNKMVAKMEPKRKVLKNWLDDLLPVTAAASANDVSSRVGTLTHLDRSGSETRVVRVNSSTKRVYIEQKRVESRIEAAIAEKLAEDVAKSYRACREHAVNNGDLQHRLKEMLEQEGVLKVFKGTTFNRQLRLAVRVYRDMMEICEQDANGRLLSVERLLLEQEDQMSLLRKKGKVVRSRYCLYKRISEKLDAMNMEHQVQKVKVLESNLLQAHESLRNKKAITLEKISKLDTETYYRIKTECEHVERLVPVHAEACEPSSYRKVRKENDSRATKEIRKVNKRLDRAVKNLQGSLLDVNSYR